MTPPSGQPGSGPGTGGPRPGSSGAPRPEPSVDPRAEPVIDNLDEAELMDPVAEAPNETVVDDLDDLLFTARRERDEYLDLSRRVQADFENYKKRMVRQQSDNLERAAENLVTKVLPVLDAFDLARAHLGDGAELSPEGKALVAGSTLLADTLEREGLKRIDNPGEPFDPTTHEAVEHTDAGGTTEDGAPSGPVVDEVLRAGYRWKGRVIRPAMVRVRG
jgi:molecular chaperone GrpE